MFERAAFITACVSANRGDDGGLVPKRYRRKQENRLQVAGAVRCGRGIRGLVRAQPGTAPTSEHDELKSLRRAIVSNPPGNTSGVPRRLRCVWRNGAAAAGHSLAEHHWGHCEAQRAAGRRANSGGIAVRQRSPLRIPVDSNRVWCADFKGWFCTADGHRVDPLTVSDAHSRYLLACQGMRGKTDTSHVMGVFETLFRALRHA